MGGISTVYLYDLNGQLIAEHDGTGTWSRDYVWLNGQPVAQVDAGEVFSYLHVDHLGTPRLATDDAQTVVWRWDSDAFGATLADGDPDGDGTVVTVNLRFPGQYYDVESGLHYNYFRTYDPATGRYLESDPIGLNGGPNTYGYVGGNPLLYTDPFGLDTTIVYNTQGIDHVGMHIDNPMGEPVLYDPSGSYSVTEKTNFPDGSSIDGATTQNLFHGDAANLDKYYDYIENTWGKDYEKIVIKTTPEEEKQIADNIFQMDTPGIMDCAADVSTVVDGIGPFAKKGKTNWPWIVARRARQARDARK